MFTQFMPSSRGGRQYEKYNDKLAVSVNKSGITIIGKSNDYLVASGFLAVLHNETRWALKPVMSAEEGGFKVSRWGGENNVRENNYHITATGFIKAAKLKLNSVYVGTMEDGMIVFSKIPTEVFGQSNG